jgi:transcriptional regulator with XRE-family HTH domain
MLQTFRERLLLARRRKGWTQQELAKRAGVTYVTISRIEIGEAKQVYVETVMRLAKALDVTTDALLGMDEFQIDRNKESTQSPSNGSSESPKRKRRAKAQA